MALSNAQYQSIMYRYDRDRANALRVQEEHLELLRREVPGFSELEGKSASIAISFARQMLNEDNSSISDLDDALSAVTAEKEALLAQYGYSPDFLLPDYTCPDCKDTGYINNRKCHCFRQAELDILYSQSNIREFLQTENFSTLSEAYYQGEDLSRFRNAVAMCHSFVDNFDTNYTNLMFYGKVGTGKSFLSGCISHELLQTGHSVIYFSATDLFALMADNAFHRSGRLEDAPSNRDIYECDLLVIDDLGTELTNQFVGSSLFTCLNERHIRRKSTIVSTNLSLQELHERYSDRVFSRAVGNFEIIKLTGNDIRVLKHKQN